MLRAIGSSRPGSISLGRDVAVHLPTRESPQQLAERRLTRPLFGQIVARIERLA